MDDTAMKEFFTRPSQTYHRQYEALRAVFVEGKSQKEAAEAFGYEYDAFRQLICRFRRYCDAGPKSTASPFFETSTSDGLSRAQSEILTRPWPIDRR